jgi:glycosyltransferase involved in cell wall biosynthesis
VSKPQVVILRGHNANVWELRIWERLTDEFAVRALVTGSNLHEVGSLGIDVVEVGTPRDRIPGGRFAGAAAYALGERYLGLEPLLAGADIVHAAELGTWFSAQAAGAKDPASKLVLTVWETLAFRDAYRWPRERGYRRRVLGAVDHCLATTERARDGLLLEGVPAERVSVCPPGVDVARFAEASPSPDLASGGHVVLSPGRLVWEKGHQDAIRAVAALKRGIVGPPRDDVTLLVVGSGPEEGKLRKYAAELDAPVEFRAKIPYDEMPRLHRSASALVLASLPTKTWEEQFGMVLAEAMAAGTPIIACDSGAIPEVLAGEGTLVPAGHWRGIAEALVAGPLAGAPGARVAYSTARLDDFSLDRAAERIGAVYRQVLASRA